MKLLKIGLALSVLGLTGCATVMSESRYPVDIQSNPTGAKFTIKDRDGREITQGTTPQKVTLEAGAGYFKKATYEITFEGKGFGKITKTLETQLDGWYWGNFAFYFLIFYLLILFHLEIAQIPYLHLIFLSLFL